MKYAHLLLYFKHRVPTQNLEIKMTRRVSILLLCIAYTATGQTLPKKINTTWR